MKKRIYPVLVAALSLIGVLYFGNLAAAAAPSSPSMSDSVTIPGIKDSGATLLFVPKAPSNLHATSTGAGFVTLHWTDNSNNEEGFIIERKSVGGTYYELESVSANTTTYEQSQLSNYPVFPGEHYYYRVKAFIGGKSSDYSNEFYIEVADNTAPVAPGNLKLTPLYSGGLKLTWDDRSNNEKGFKIERKMEGGQWNTVQTAGENATEYEQTEFDMPGGVRYTFRVKVFNDTGSAYSNEAGITTPTHAPAPPVLMYYNLFLTSTSSITISWQDKSDNEDGFVILRKKASDNREFNYLVDYVGVVNKDVTEYVDSNLPPDEVFEYMVGAYTMSDHSWSGIAKAPITGPKQPSVAATVVSNSEVRIDWSCPTSGVDFYLQRKTPGGEYHFVHDWFYANQNIYHFNDTNLSPGQTYYYKLSVGRNAAVPALQASRTCSAGIC